jgi:hypothetical protein
MPGIGWLVLRVASARGIQAAFLQLCKPLIDRRAPAAASAISKKHSRRQPNAAPLKNFTAIPQEG